MFCPPVQLEVEIVFANWNSVTTASHTVDSVIRTCYTVECVYAMFEC